MLGSLLAALRSGDALDQAFSKFDEMLSAGQWMFSKVRDILEGRLPPADAREELFTKDQEINELLRSLRSNLVTHLSVNKNADIAACLALMSIAKDAERIGDYCKNLFEVTEYGDLAKGNETYKSRIAALPGEVEQVFGLVRTAFSESESKQAKVAIKAADAIRATCDEIGRELLEDHDQISTQDAVSVSLQARYYKRITSHLANIATAVFGRIEELDFRKPPQPTGSDAPSR
jgi:phosphate uptake regulator